MKKMLFAIAAMVFATVTPVAHAADAGVVDVNNLDTTGYHYFDRSATGKCTTGPGLVMALTAQAHEAHGGVMQDEALAKFIGDASKAGVPFIEGQKIDIAIGSETKNQTFLVYFISEATSENPKICSYLEVTPAFVKQMRGKDS